MKTAIAAAVLVMLVSPAIAGSKHVDFAARCQSVDVPDDLLNKCAADLKACSAKKSVAKCEAELFSPDQG